MQSKFAEFHPSVIFLYFIIVIAFSMFVLHPYFLIISLFFSLSYSAMLGGIKTLKFNILIILPMTVFSTLINILFNRNGQTIIGYLPWDVPITYETIIAGLATSAMISIVICWFSCYNIIMTNDKFLYLFGKKMPVLSLIMSMVFRFVPRFKSQFKKTATAQKCIGYDISSGNFLHRIKSLSRVISVMSLWALENSIETADSMKSRGYELKNKTNFKIYKWRSSDTLAFIFIVSSFIYIFINILNNKIFYEYYPTVTIKTNAIPVFVIFMLLCAMPIIIEIREILKWKYYQSKI